MKKLFLFLALLMFAGLSSPSLSFAQEDNGKDTQRASSVPAVNLSTSPLQRMMMLQAMRDKSVVSTTDGGIIIVINNKIMKYDKDLNLVKETEIQMPQDLMEQAMIPDYRKARMLSQSQTADAVNSTVFSNKK